MDATMLKTALVSKVRVKTETSDALINLDQTQTRATLVRGGAIVTTPLLFHLGCVICLHRQNVA